MSAGIMLVVLGLVMFSYGYLKYRQEDKKLANLKRQDLVTYYLDLFYNLLPVPFWSALIGVVLVVVGVVVILVMIPFTV